MHKKPLILSCLALLLSGSLIATGAGAAFLPLVASSDRDLADVEVHASATNALWIFPGVRNLDPSIFGTVAEPLGTEFMIGIPTYDRIDDGAGHWTTTATPKSASNNTQALSAGSVQMTMIDRTPADLPTFGSTTFDEVRCRAEFTDPFGRQIVITANQPLPKGPFHEFMGGVGTNFILHGRTGIGARLVPQIFSYGAFWARGTVAIDGVVLPGNSDRLVHGMITWGVRDASNSPGPAGGNGPFLASSAAEVDPNDLEFHLLCPDIRFPAGPQPNSPVVGVGQEFLHIVFENVTVSGSSIRGVLNR